jgi:hypothetical protein
MKANASTDPETKTNRFMTAPVPVFEEGVRMRARHSTDQKCAEATGSITAFV